jgi:hypothetical protein
MNSIKNMYARQYACKDNNTIKNLKNPNYFFDVMDKQNEIK